MKSKRDFLCVKEKAARTEEGFALVEMMVAIVVISLLMMGVMDGMAKCREQGSAVQNQIIAANIAQELMDAARDQSWSKLLASAGTVNLAGNYLNHATGSLATGGISYIPRPLLTDPATTTYSNQTWDTTSNSGKNIFRGSVTQTITDLGTVPDTISIVINVSWPSETGGTAKQLTQSTVISQSGIHN
jgi:prepilin-type N-terminal cleavage/methylation domain-containing protein